MVSTSSQTYAFVSHESAVEAIWSAAARHWEGLLDDENVWLIAAPEYCVKNQRDFKELSKSVDLSTLGISKRPVDLLVPNKSCCSRGKQARFHVWQRYFPEHSFIRVHERVLVSTPYFAVMQLAAAQRASRLSEDEARAVADEYARAREQLGADDIVLQADELLAWQNISRVVRAAQVLTDFQGTYRYLPAEDGAEDATKNVEYGTKPIIVPNRYEEYLAEMGPERGIMRAREVAGLSFSGSASPMETALALMLTLPSSMGGFALPRPRLNYETPFGPLQRELMSQEAMFGDLCWPEQRLIAEYYGWEDHAGLGPRKVGEDCARANSLEALGWNVIHVTYEQIRTLEGMSLVARQIASLLGVELQEPTELERVWRLRLHALLLPETKRLAW